MRLHIDADLLVYRCGFAAEKSEYYLNFHDAEYDEDRTVFFQYHADMKKYIKKHELADYEIEKKKNLEPVENALHNVKSMIETSVQAVDSDDVILYLSGPTNFREEIATLRVYKGNRDPDHKPTHGPAIKEYMHKHWPVVVSDNEEADDVVGYSHYAMYLDDPWSTVIVSIDKDLDMIPGLHYNWIKETGYSVDDEYANATFWTQLLQGDSTDNIPGIPGMGPKGAEEAMQDAWHWSNSGEFDEEKAYEIARALYVQSYGEEEADNALLENGRLIWIRRQPGELWTPPEL